MKWKLVVAGMWMMSVLAVGCSASGLGEDGNAVSSEVNVSAAQADAGAGEQEKQIEASTDEEYALPENVTVAADYEQKSLQVPISQIVDDFADAEYPSVSIDSHGVYQAEEAGYDRQDQVMLTVQALDPSGFLSQSINKKVVYLHNESTGQWELSKEMIKTWDVDKSKIKWNKTFWHQHFEDVSQLDADLFLDKDKNQILPELDPSQEADFYVYLKGDQSFFYVKEDPNSGTTREAIFYTEGSGILYLEYDGQVYQKEIHYVEGTIDDKGTLLIKPEDGDVYFDLWPDMESVPYEEYETFLTKLE